MRIIKTTKKIKRFYIPSLISHLYSLNNSVTFFYVQLLFELIFHYSKTSCVPYHLERQLS